MMAGEKTDQSKEALYHGESPSRREIAQSLQSAILGFFQHVVSFFGRFKELFEALFQYICFNTDFQ